ncbi:universal stress protein [Fructobacillus parabroussonetiae]|uniref:Universal stress protein n=1 Tax=Fructobacillus parabroussonetiae TaxID=2713174 RepID=A0ABS5QUV3_9LACO|nr:universal stress protein [Fructobacillus parabroussonetiae]MBS9336970.1 universal stress protein [Fructobacillus parabroussonetiae]MCK8617417.1 universal stress protein [Fructobacillus parabroussonetiae]
MAELQLNIEPKHFKNILVGVDESEQGYNALANAIHQAREDDAHLIIASVLEMGDLSAVSALHLDVIKEKREEIEKNLEKYRAYAEKQGVQSVDTVFDDGVKFGEILVEDISPRVNADLVVVGAHSREGFWGSIGSQAAYIARNSKTSVLIVQN